MSKVNDVDWAAVEERYKELLPGSKRLTKLAIRRLQESVRGKGIRSTVYGRPKGLTNVLGKVIRKGEKYGPDPVGMMTDLAGVRAILTYASDITRVQDAIEDAFDVVRTDNKTEDIDPFRLDYLGVHFDVRIRPEDLEAADKDLADRLVEIQVQTRAQNVWADISHELLYKSKREPPSKSRRSIMRLEVLVELFDEEVTRARAEIMKDGFLEGRLLSFLEPHFYRLGGDEYDEELSMDVLSVLHPLYGADALADMMPLIEKFTLEEDAKLRTLFHIYEDDRSRNPLLWTPAAILVFERINEDPDHLQDAWAQTLPLTFLESLSIVWGSPINAGD